MALIGGALGIVAGKLKDIASDIITVRTGTIVSDNASALDTAVTLDNDPTGATVSALGLNGPLPTGTRVAMLAYPPRGLLVIGAMDPDVVTPGITQLTGGPTSIPKPSGPYEFFVVEGCGGGGAGGGAALSSAGNCSFGGGGGGGMWGRSVFRVNELAWPLSATAGTGGAGSAGATGGDGGRSTLVDANAVTIWAAEGGVGGQTLANGNTEGQAANPGIGSAGGGFTFQTGFFGGDGERVMRLATAQGMGGQGGASYYGGGGAGGAQAVGNAASVPGAGGGGAGTHNSAVGPRAGGNGGVGVVDYNFL